MHSVDCAKVSYARESGRRHATPPPKKIQSLQMRELRAMLSQISMTTSVFLIRKAFWVLLIFPVIPVFSAAQQPCNGREDGAKPQQHILVSKARVDLECARGCFCFSGGMTGGHSEAFHKQNACLRVLEVRGHKSACVVRILWGVAAVWLWRSFGGFQPISSSCDPNPLGPFALYKVDRALFTSASRVARPLWSKVRSTHSTFTFCKPCFSPCLAQKRAKKIWPDLGQIFDFFLAFQVQRALLPPGEEPPHMSKVRISTVLSTFWKKKGIFQKMLKTGDLLNC